MIKSASRPGITSFSCRPVARRLAALAWVLFSVLGTGAVQGIEVEFPGPVPVDGLGEATSAVSIPWQDGEARYLAIGSEDGFLRLVRLLSGGDNFNILDRQFMEGRVVQVAHLENPAPYATGLVIATADPDRITFLGIQPFDPFFVILDAVDLPEDPGTLAFCGPGQPGGQELAVSLPGIDKLALLAATPTGWTLDQILPTGDRPRSLTAVDLEDDGVREIVTADSGALSGVLGIFRRDPDGLYTRTRQQELPGWPELIRAQDLDGDGRPELAVALADAPEVLFLQTGSGQMTMTESVELTLTAESMHLGPLPEGGIGLYTAVGDRGLVEFQARDQVGWRAVESYYPGCRPYGLTSGDLNGDGYEELVCLGSSLMPTTIMFGLPDGGFQGYPALALNTLPGAAEIADFDLDGQQDLVVAGAEQPLLSFFAGQPDGGLATMALDKDLGYLVGGLAILEAGGSEGPELALIDAYTAQLHIYDYDQDQHFQLMTSRQILPLPNAVGAADMNGDGVTDLFMARRNASDLLVIYGDGAGHFTGDVTVPLSFGARDILALDLNGDALLDLVTVDGVSRAYGYINQGDGTFGDGTFALAGTGARFLAAGDLDGDGDLDLVVANRTEESLSFLENDGSGSLVRRIGAHALPAAPMGLECVDLDGSGHTDVVVNLGDTGRIGVVLGLGEWIFGPVLQFAGGTNISSFRLGDFNLDGFTDILNLDGSLELGLAMLNLDSSQVAVAPEALSLSCSEAGLDLKVVPDRIGPWEVALGRDGNWVTLARDGQALRGILDHDGRAWWLQVPWSELPPGALAGPDSRQVRLAVGETAVREFLILELDPGCGPAAGGLPAVLGWAREPWPNPFNPSIRSRVVLTRPVGVSASIHDLTGRRVAEILRGELPAGEHTLTWDGTAAGRPAAAGVYFLRVEAPGTVLSRKVVLLK